MLLRVVLDDRIKKAKRLLEGKAISVAGPDCRRRPLKACKFNKPCENEVERNRYKEPLLQHGEPVAVLKELYSVDG